MIVKKLRLQKCWSQEQLSQFSGLSVRTIQRIERGQQASLESLKSLAAVFQVNINDLQPEQNMDTQTDHPIDKNSHIIQIDIEEKNAMEYVEGVKSFYYHLLTYFIIVSCLSVVNLIISPEYLWVLWCAGGWGVGIIIQAMHTFEVFTLFSPAWEKKQIEKRLGREL